MLLIADSQTNMSELQISHPTITHALSAAACVCVCVCVCTLPPCGGVAARPVCRNKDTARRFLILQ